MGCYLSKPVTVKESQDADNESCACGLSSMQGWRENQEDSHTCKLDFAQDTSLFAVYDGHGGVEVAQYAAEKLPSLIKNDLFETGDYENALIKAFLEFDDSLITEAVLARLTEIREESAELEDEEDAEDDEKEELSELYKEAEIPIEEIISRYNERKSVKNEGQPGSSKVLQSPFLKAPQRPKPKSSSDEETSCSSGSSSKVTDDSKTNISNGDSESKPKDDNKEPEDSSSSKVNGTPVADENKEDVSAVAISSEAECGPSSSKEQNGSGKRFRTVRLTPYESDSEETDEDDEMFEVSENTNDESNSDYSEDEEFDEEEDDSIVCDDESEEDLPGKDSGCTAVVALLVKNKLYVANAGDSRCVVSIDGKAHDMSEDHKPEDEPELKRIRAAGGRVSNDGRVNGGLNLSRALGDHNYKKNKELPNTEQMITALPDVKVMDIEPGNNNFLVLACDGIWNSFTSQEVVDFISKRINKPDVKLSSICEELFDECLAPDTFSDGTGCDNMTCIIVRLKQNHKRPHVSDEEDTSAETVDCKKPKLDSAETVDCKQPELDSAETESNH